MYEFAPFKTIQNKESVIMDKDKIFERYICDMGNFAK